MHWIIQKSIFKPANFELLVNALTIHSIKYSVVSIPRGTFDIEPNIEPEGKVYVCGAIKMAKIAQERAWHPGSFLDSNFNLRQWNENLGSEMLNFDLKYGKFRDISVEDNIEFFIRPVEDNKAFDGMVLDSIMLDTWRRDKSKNSLLDIDVALSSVKTIYREYRLFVVDSKVVTGSMYKVAGNPQVSADVESDIIEYVERIIGIYTPSETFVIDIAMTEDGLRVIEFNNINSSGFYACDVSKYVQAIVDAYG